MADARRSGLRPGAPLADAVELLWRIHRWSEANDGKRPTVRQLDSDPSLPSYKTVKRHHGTTKQAFELAGVLDGVNDGRGRKLQ